jgi:hypothetical protein
MVLWVAFLLIMASAPPAGAGIVVHIADSADPDTSFWVETKSNHALIHGSSVQNIDERFVRPGETANISVLALNPITFSFVYASMYHPAYLYDLKSVSDMPSALRTVRIPTFTPRSWRDFIASGQKVHHAGQGIHLMNVVNHLQLFITPYLPALDNAGIREDLTKYIPLFEQLIAHTEKTLPQTTYGDSSIEERRQKDPVYARKLDQREQQHLKELRDLLSEIKALLALGTEERLRLRSLQAKLVNTGSVFHHLMTAQDRRTVEELLERQLQSPRPEKTRHWVSSSTNVSYSMTVRDRYVLNRAGKQRYEHCYRTGLDVALDGGRPPILKNMHKRFSANFCRDDRGEWAIQLPGK